MRLNIKMYLTSICSRLSLLRQAFFDGLFAEIAKIGNRFFVCGTNSLFTVLPTTDRFETYTEDGRKFFRGQFILFSKFANARPVNPWNRQMFWPGGAADDFTDFSEFVFETAKLLPEFSHLTLHFDHRAPSARILVAVFKPDSSFDFVLNRALNVSHKKSYFTESDYPVFSEPSPVTFSS